MKSVYGYECQSCKSISYNEDGIVAKKCSCGSPNFKKVVYMPKQEEFLDKLHFIKEINQEEFKQFQKDMYDCWRDVDNLIEVYLDIEPNYRKIISLWIIGTYFHDSFQSYPYLFLNAMRGSGKTRLLKIIKSLSRDGEILNSLTEAILFRTKGTLCIDEFESIGRKGSENLRELLNSAYKKGTIVKRMVKKKTAEGEEQVPESFDVYRPIAMANITGIDDVLGDRSIQIILEKSINKSKTKLVENFDDNIKFNNIRYNLAKLNPDNININVDNVGNVGKQLCRYIHEIVFECWNDYISQTYIYTNYIHTLSTFTTFTTLKDKFKVLMDSNLTGRDLELALPLLTLTLYFDEDLFGDIFGEILKWFEEVAIHKQEEERVENYDISLSEWISQQPESTNFIPLKEITEEFKKFLGVNDEWLGNKWIVRSLKRLNLIKEKKRKPYGTGILLDFNKAKKKMEMFK